MLTELPKWDFWLRNIWQCNYGTLPVVVIFPFWLPSFPLCYCSTVRLLYRTTVSLCHHATAPLHHCFAFRMYRHSIVSPVPLVYAAVHVICHCSTCSCGAVPLWHHSTRLPFHCASAVHSASVTIPLCHHSIGPLCRCTNVALYHHSTVLSLHFASVPLIRFAPIGLCQSITVPLLPLCH